MLAGLLALLCGVFAISAWALRLGFIGDLLSKPVLLGYMAGVAVIMVVSQLGKVTGVDVAGDSIVHAVASFASNLGDVSWPTDTALVAIIRDARVIAPSPDDTLEAGDELLFVSAPDQEPELQRMLGHL